MQVERYDFASMNEKSTKRLLQKDAVFHGSSELLFDDVAKAQEQPEVIHLSKPPWSNDLHCAIVFWII